MDFMLKGTRVHKAWVPFIMHLLQWLGPVSRCVISAIWYSSTMLEVPESTKLEYGSGILTKKCENRLDSYSRSMNSSTVEVPESTKLKYGLGLNSYTCYTMLLELEYCAHHSLQ